MSQLPAAVKSLINSPKARPGTLPASRNIADVYKSIQRTAVSNLVSRSSWIALSAAATMTMNSPGSLSSLFQLATESLSPKETISVAEMMREVGLKCTSFNGIPRTINCLNAFRAGLPDPVVDNLSTVTTRTPTAENIQAIADRGCALWDSIYRPFEKKLYDKLADAHPDLPVHILNSHYGALLADPVTRIAGANVGRVLTSIVAISCLRAQTGVGPQVLSHVFGLRKAGEDGTWTTDVESEEGFRWLASDDGNVWLLTSVDEIVDSISDGLGSSFAPERSFRL